LGADYPAIIPIEGSEVRGSVVTGLMEGDVYRLDIFEGYQYERKVVKVKVLKDIKLDEAAASSVDRSSTCSGAKEEEEEYVEAETYVWICGRDTLEPEEWDFEQFKKEKMRAWMGLADYGDVEYDDDDDNDHHYDSSEDEEVESAKKAKGNKAVLVDEGFADVDRAVAELEERDREFQQARENGDVNEKKKKDPMGGRGLNGNIGRQLEASRSMSVGENGIGKTL